MYIFFGIFFGVVAGLAVDSVTHSLVADACAAFIVSGIATAVFGTYFKS